MINKASVRPLIFGRGVAGKLNNRQLVVNDIAQHSLDFVKGGLANCSLAPPHHPKKNAMNEADDDRGERRRFPVIQAKRGRDCRGHKNDQKSDGSEYEFQVPQEESHGGSP